MIEQKAIYEAAQTAFSNEHPKFPFPKRHDLEDQTDEFKRAFLHLSTEINAMHEREIESIAERNVKLAEETRQAKDKKDVAEKAESLAKEVNREVRQQRDRAKFQRNCFAWLLFFALFFIGIVVALTFLFETCVPQMLVEDARFQFPDSVATYGFLGEVKVMPICNF